jgi:PAS domain S-box-containing protein
MDRQYAATQNEIFDRVRLISGAVDQALSDIESNLRILATSPTLKSGDLAAFYQHAVAAVRLSEGTAIVLVDRTGNFVINTVGPFGAPATRRVNRAAENRVFATGMPQISDLFIARVQQRPVISVEVPVRLDEKVQYVLAMGLSPDYFTKLLERQRAPADWRVGILDRQGIIITRIPDPQQYVGRLATGSFADLNGQQSGRWRQRVTQTGTPVYVSFARSQRTGWTVAVSVPQAATDAPYWQAAASAAAVGGTVVALSVVAALLAAAAISRPLTQLTSAAEAIGRGEQLPLEPAGLREIDTVQRAMVEAAAQRDRARRERETTAQTLSAILATTDDPIYLFDAEKRFRYVGSAGLKLMRRPEAEVIGKTWRELALRPAVMEPLERLLDTVIATGQSVTSEIEYPRGTYWDFHLDPMRGSDGPTIGVVATFRDITAHRRSENALRASEARLQTERNLLEAVVRSMPVGVLVVEAKTGRFQFANDILPRIWGRQGTNFREWGEVVGGRQYHSEGRAYGPDELPISRSLRNGEVVFNEEITYRNPDGTDTTIVVNAAPVRSADGDIVAAVGAIFDVTDRKQAMDRQKLLLDEINHRSKNTMATIQSIAHLSLRSAGSLQAFASVFQSRLISLSNAHDLLTRHRWQGATLSDVLHATLAPYLDADRIVFSGERVYLSPKVALALTAGVHELSTNSAKYGALSVPGGRVEVAWRIHNVGARATVTLTWEEHGGPPVEPPSRRGFGTRFIQSGLAGDLDGEVDLDFAPAGVRCRIAFPLFPRQRVLGASA